MIKTIEDLREDVAKTRRKSQAHLERRDRHGEKYMKSHLKFIETAQEYDAALAALIAALGEPS